MCIIVNTTKFSFNFKSLVLHLSLLFELHPKVIFVMIQDDFLMVNARKKTGVILDGRFRLLWALVTSLTCFSPNRLTCPLNSAVVLASYAVQCKSPRAHCTGAQPILTGIWRKSLPFPVWPGLFPSSQESCWAVFSLVVWRVPLSPQLTLSTGTGMLVKEGGEGSPHNKSHLTHIIPTRPSLTYCVS